MRDFYGSEPDFLIGTGSSEFAEVSHFSMAGYGTTWPILAPCESCNVILILDYIDAG
jgi:hypothetical protein